MTRPSDLDPTLPWSKAARSPDERDKIKAVIARLGLCGLANDTKWDEFLAAMRPKAAGRQSWRFSYRYKCVDGPPRPWDVEWFFHLPFPMISVEWMDVAFLQETVDDHIPKRTTVVDHSPWLLEALQTIGLDYRKGELMVRIFGYSPRDMEGFDLEEYPPGR